MGRNVLLPERPGGETPTETKRPGAKRIGGETSYGQKKTSGGNGLGQNDSDFKRQDSNMFYPLQMNLMQTLELIEEAFRKP